MQRIVDEGRADAQRRAEGADEYAVGVLRGLQDELRQLAQQVDNGILVMGGESEDSQRVAAQPVASPGKRKK